MRAGIRWSFLSFVLVLVFGFVLAVAADASAPVALVAGSLPAFFGGGVVGDRLCGPPLRGRIRGGGRRGRQLCRVRRRRWHGSHRCWFVTRDRLLQ